MEEKIFSLTLAIWGFPVVEVVVLVVLVWVDQVCL